jgi:hypothetical protein
LGRVAGPELLRRYAVEFLCQRLALPCGENALFSVEHPVIGGQRRTDDLSPRVTHEVDFPLHLRPCHAQPFRTADPEFDREGELEVRAPLEAAVRVRHPLDGRVLLRQDARPGEPATCFEHPCLGDEHLRSSGPGKLGDTGGGQ